MRTKRKTPTSSPFKGNQNTLSVFGSSAFGSQSGALSFGGTATGVSGATQASTSTIGAPFAPAFGSNSPSFDSGTSVFGKKPSTTFGEFGSTARQANPFGSTALGQSQPALGSTSFNSSASLFGCKSPSFGTIPFGTMLTPAFGTTSMPAFCAASIPAFGALSVTAFSASSAPTLGASTSPAFGVCSTPFGSSSSSLYGSSTPAFGQTTSAFGNTSSPLFCSTSMLGSSGAAISFGAQSAPAFVGSLPTFGSSTFNGSFISQQNGTRATSYAPTNDLFLIGVVGEIAKLMSITAMSTYETKSFEELRWEDYEAGDKDSWDPFSRGGLKQMLNSMDWPFLDDMARARARGGAMRIAGIRAPWDVTEDEEGFYIRVDIPGFAKEDVKVAVEDSVLVVTGHRDRSKEDPRWAAKSSSKFNTRLALPHNVCLDKISAELKNGVLFVTFPKLKPEDRKFDIQVT